MTENNDNNDEINSNTTLNGLINPHDGLFKIFLQDKAIAKEFVEIHLPERYQKICDLNTIEIEPNSFIETDFSPYYSDMLYSMNTKKGQKGFVYLIIEHQSSPDPMIAWRLFNYAIQAINHHIKQNNNPKDKNHKKSKHRKSPVVIPLLFYTGNKPHPESISLDWYDTFDDPEFAREVYNHSFEIRSSRQIPDDEIKQHKRVGLMEYVYKNIKTKDLMDIIDDIDGFLVTNEFTAEQRRAILLYVANQGKIKQPKQLLEKLTTKSVTQEGDNTMTSLADYLRQEGMAAGMAAGRLEGMAIGRQQAQVETTQAIARNMLSQGCELALIRSVTGLTDEEIKKLQS